MKNNSDKKFKRTEIGMIPSDWEVVLLGNNIEIQRGGSPRPIEKYLTDSIDGVNWIKIGDTNPTDKYIKFTNEKITKEGTIHSREVHKGEFLLSNSMSYGRPYILNIDGYIHDGWLVLRHFEETFNVDYLYYYLSYNVVKNQYDNLASGSGVKNLNKDIVKKVIVAKPPKPEQEKIANALTRIDNLIEDYEKLIKKKEKIKQGLMQNLLTGKVRLKGFDDKWEKVLLEEVLDYEQPTKYIVRSTNYLNKGIPVLTAGKSLILGYTNELIDVYDKGEVIIFDDFLTTSKFINYPFKIKSSAIKLLTKKRGMDCLSFIYYKMQDIDFLAYEHKRYWISEYSKIKIELPSGKEQQAISQVLSNADNKINDLKIKLNKIIDIKKGMLDNLLTGRIRL